MLKALSIIMGAVLFTTLTMSIASSFAQSHEEIKPKLLQDGWQVASPKDVGIDAEKLVELTNAAQSGDIQNLHAIIIERNNMLVYEEYFSGPDQLWGMDIGGDVDFDENTLHDLRSISKSVTTALLGIAMGDEFHNELENKVVSYLPEIKSDISEAAKQITLQHALTMTAGLQWNEMEEPYTTAKNDELAMQFVDQPVKMALARDAMTPAGESWYYSGGMTEVISAIITSKTKLPLDKYAKKVLFGPLEIKQYQWVGSRRWLSPSAASGLRLGARDLAKIGSLYLHNGKWNGTQIVPEGWVKASTQAHVPSVPWGDGFANYGYGFMWYPGESIDGQNIEIIRAAGWGGQRLFLLPQYDMSISIFAGNYRGEGEENDMKILQAILAAVEE